MNNNVTKNHEAKTRNCDCINVYSCTLDGHFYLFLEPYSHRIWNCYHVTFLRTYVCIIFDGKSKAKKWITEVVNNHPINVTIIWKLDKFVKKKSLNIWIKFEYINQNIVSPKFYIRIFFCSGKAIKKEAARAAQVSLDGLKNTSSKVVRDKCFHLR